MSATLSTRNPTRSQPRCIVARSGEIPRHASFAIDSAPVQGSNQCRPDFVHAAMAPTFGNEAPAGSQRAVDGRDHRVGALDPACHRIAKDGIELIPERQRFTVHDVRVGGVSALEAGRAPRCGCRDTFDNET